MPRHVRRTIAIVYVASFATTGLTQAFTVLLFFLLPTAGVGLVNWGTAAGAIIFYVLDLGIATTLVVTAKQEVVRLGTMVAVVSAFRLVTAAIVGVAWLIGTVFHLLGPSESAVLALVLLGFIVRQFQTPFICWLQVLGHQGGVAILGLVPMIGRLVLLAVLWREDLITIQSVLLASLAGDVIGLLAMGAMASRYEGQAGPSIQPWRLAVKLLRTSPMLTTSQAILMMQSRFDWLLVAAFASYSALANYAVANKATELLVLSGSILGRNALPWLVEGWSHPGVARTVRWLGVAVNFAGLALAFLGWPLLHLVFNDKYAGAAPVIPVLAALTPALTLYQVLQFALLAKQRTRDVVVASGLALGAQVAIDLGAIPTLGIMGAALGMCGFTAVAFPLALSVALKRNLLTRSTAAELGFAAGALPLVLLATLGIGRL
jgi:O-antigen/teichoic acid export membrane protein